MASPRVKFLLVCAVGMMTINCIQCQISYIANGILQITSLVEKVNETTTTMSCILSHLSSSHKNQDMQIVTNLLLENSTAVTKEVAKGVHGILRDEKEKQDQLVALIQNQLHQHNETSCLLQDHQNKFAQVENLLSQVANTQTWMVDSIENRQVCENQTIHVLQHNHKTVEKIASVQNEIVSLLQNQQNSGNITVILLKKQQDNFQMEGNLAHMVNGQTQIISLLESQQEWQNQTMTLLKSHLTAASQTENLHTQMITQMVTTQMRMAESLDQMVRQLQVVHNPQLGCQILRTTNKKLLQLQQLPHRMTQ